MTNTGRGKWWWFGHEGKTYRVPDEILNRWESSFGERFWDDGTVPDDLHKYEADISKVELHKK